jgi:flavin-dependent dehydrogenase
VTDVDVLVVGARVGGAATAALLGDAGYRVLLVDAATFPSDTISTHFFRGAGLGSVLARLGLIDHVLALGSPPLTCEYVYVGMDPEPAVGPPQDPGELGFDLSVRRHALDGLLVARARATPGVEVREGAVARELLRDGARVTGAIIDQAETREEVRARIVVGADGRGSRVARWVEATVERREIATRALYFRYLGGFRGPGGSWDGAEFSMVGDEMSYVFPSDDDVACLAMSINLAVFQRFRQDPEGVFDERIAGHPGLAERYLRAERLGRLLGSGPFDALIRSPAGPGWALVGDASMCQDPWSGLGMDNAGVHAGFLADAIDGWLSGRATETAAFASYRERRDSHAREGFDETAQLGRDLSVMTSGAVSAVDA